MEEPQYEILETETGYAGFFSYSALPLATSLIQWRVEWRPDA